MSEDCIYEQLPYGFRYRAATVERWCSDERKGWVLLAIRTPKHDHDKKRPPVEVYVTKTGKVRVFCGDEEWGPVKKGEA